MTSKEMEKFIVRYADLKPCKTAFIDAHTPGSNQKENFTIIGSGVSESPDQHVPVSYTHLRAHETPEHLVCRLLLEKKKTKKKNKDKTLNSTI